MPITDVDQAIANSPALQTDEFTAAASQSFRRSTPCRPVADESRTVPRARARRRVPRSHHLRAKGCRRVRLVARGVGGGGLPAQSRRGGQLRRPQAGQSFGAPADFRLTGFTFDRGRSSRSRSRSVTHDGHDRRADRDRDPLRDDPAEMSGTRPRRRRSRQPFRAAPIRRPSTSTSRPASSRATWPPGSSRRSSATGWRRSRSTCMADATAGAVTFNRLIQGFMGLDLRQVAAPWSSSPAPWSSRQQIGVMRAIGFRRGMIEAVVPSGVPRFSR